MLDNQSEHNCVRGIKTSFCSNTQFRRVTSVGRSTVRNVNENTIPNFIFQMDAKAAAQNSKMINVRDVPSGADTHNKGATTSK